MDTNILVYAHRDDSPWHESARTSYEGFAVPEVQEDNRSAACVAEQAINVAAATSAKL